MSVVGSQPGQVRSRRPVALAAWAALAVVGAAAWAALLTGDDPARAWRALLINFIFFTPMAAGMVVWPAMLTAARAEWLPPVRESALAGVAMGPVSLAAFAALWFGRAHWAGWLWEPHLHNAAWLNEPFLFGRDAVALVVFWSLATVYVAGLGRWKTRQLPAVLTLTFALVFTLLGFDLVMALDPHWFSTLFGGYFFISGMYAAVAAWTLVALLRRPGLREPGRRHDLGKLIVAFSLLTMYMMYSQLIVIWYEQLPEEVRFVIPRLARPPWASVSAVLLAVVYLGPLVLLLTIRAKRSPRFLGAVALLVLAGLWVERWWLVTPTLGGPMAYGLPEATITLAFVGAFGFGVQCILPYLPAKLDESGTGVSRAAYPPVLPGLRTGGQAASGTRPNTRGTSESEGETP